MRYRCNVVVSVGAVLEHRTSGELRYYHPPSNNSCLFEHKTLVSSEVDLSNLFATVQLVDLCDVAATRPPSMEWKVCFVTNITFYLDKMLGAGLVGYAMVILQSYMHNNRYVVGIDKNKMIICVSFVVWPCALTAFVVGDKGTVVAGLRNCAKCECLVCMGSTDITQVRW